MIMADTTNLSASSASKKTKKKKKRKTGVKGEGGSPDLLLEPADKYPKVCVATAGGVGGPEALGFCSKL